jgi:hypothetical protein
LAQADRQQGRLLAASVALRQCLTPECSPILREDCARLLSEVERDTPSVVLAAESAQGDLVQVTVYDGAYRIADALDGAAVRRDPGEHYFTFRAEGMKPETRFVVLRAGEHNRRIAVRLEPLPLATAEPEPVSSLPVTPALPSRGDPVITYSLLGAGAALGVAGLWLGLSAKSDYEEAEESCAPVCRQVVRDRIRYKSLAADGLFVLSGAAVAFGVVRLLTTGGPTPRATVWLGPGQVTAKGRF